MFTYIEHVQAFNLTQVHIDFVQECFGLGVEVYVEFGVVVDGTLDLRKIQIIVEEGLLLE